MPHTRWHIQGAHAQAEEMFKRYPKIPNLA